VASETIFQVTLQDERGICWAPKDERDPGPGTVDICDSYTFTLLTADYDTYYEIKAWDGFASTYQEESTISGIIDRLAEDLSVTGYTVTKTSNSITVTADSDGERVSTNRFEAEAEDAGGLQSYWSESEETSETSTTSDCSRNIPIYVTTDGHGCTPSSDFIEVPPVTNRVPGYGAGYWTGPFTFIASGELYTSGSGVGASGSGYPDEASCGPPSIFNCS